MSINTFQLTLSRLRARILPLRTLTLANKIFANVEEGTLIDTNLFGYVMPVNVSRSTTHRMLALVGEAIIPEAQLISRMIKPDQTVIDVGANIGYYTALFKKYQTNNAKVICLEPEPQNLTELRRFVEHNQLTSVDILAAGAGAEQGKLYLQGGVNGRVQEGAGGDSTQLDQFEVPIICVDQFLVEQPGLVKIDVEGFEGQVLKGMQQMMKVVQPNIFVEVHPMLLNYGFSVDDVFNLCRPYYSIIECWDHTEGNTVFQKLLFRYQTHLSLRRLAEPAAMIEDCKSGKQKEPFWMICRGK